MKKVMISNNWMFESSEQGKKPVDLPHDYVVGNPRDPQAAGGVNTGFTTGTKGQYTKYMVFGEAPHYMLQLDGAYMCAKIWFNDNLLAMHPHGYTPYLVDLSGRVRAGRNNKIRVTTDTMDPSSRWYNGGGLYRDVFLWSGGKVRVEPFDLFITTEAVEEGEARMNAALTVTADVAAEAAVHFAITFAGDPVMAFDQALSLQAGKNAFDIPFAVEQPRLWDCDNPNLYAVTVTISVDGAVEDTYDSTFGIRTMVCTGKDGLLINGKETKLRGGCIHHDNGGLGAAANPSAIRRKLTILKNAGFNAIRNAHNPPSTALLEICDSLGLYVMDEAFDMWNVPKNPNDYSLWFRDWYARDIALMVRRDRNYPCVISYSIGNEIEERQGTSDGAYWAEMLCAEIRKHDATRLVTSALCGMWYACEEDAPEDYKEDFQTYNKQGFADAGYGTVESSFAPRVHDYAVPLDIVGYNYLHFRYDHDAEANPDRVYFGSETKALEFAKSWGGVMRHKNIIGDFTWTAYDNLGEAGCGRSVWARDGELLDYAPGYWPWRTCYQGDFGLCGFKQPQSYFRESFWHEDMAPAMFAVHPEHYGEGFSGTGWHWYDVLDTWSFEDAYLGKPVEVQVYTAADEVQFVLNGRPVAIAIPEEHIARAGIPYERGTLVAVAYKKGVEMGRCSLSTTGEAAKLQLEAETAEAAADGRELIYVRAYILDAAGNRVAAAANELTCTVEGAVLNCFFSEDPMSEDDYMSGVCHAFEGRALAIVSSKTAGTATIRVAGEGLETAECTVIFR